MEDWKTAFGEVLPMTLSEQARSEVCEDFDGVPEGLTAARAIALSMVSKAMRGDVRAYDIIRASMQSDKPGEFKLEITYDGEK